MENAQAETVVAWLRIRPRLRSWSPGAGVLMSIQVRYLAISPPEAGR